MDLYVLIATANRPHLLEQTLDSLAKCHKPDSYRGTVVVENGPEQIVEKLVGRFEHPLAARYLHVVEANKSNALNEALRLLPDAFLFFTDDDVNVHSDTLVAYAHAAQGSSGGAFYGGPVTADYDGPPPREWLRPFLPLSARGWSLPTNSECYEPPEPVLFLGFNWGAFTVDLANIGGFDPDFGPGSPLRSTGQERNAQTRLLESGCRQFYVRDALVSHKIPESRCSPRWVLKRAYRTGIQRGLENRGTRSIYAQTDGTSTNLKIIVNSNKFFSLNPKHHFGVYFGVLYCMGFIRAMAWRIKRAR